MSSSTDDDKLTVSVVIATLNREEPLRQTLRYFLDQEVYSPFEIIVVDQTVTHDPATEQFLARCDRRLNVVRADFQSLPRARNLGVEQARGEIVLFVDDDVEPGPGFLSAHVEPYRDAAIWGVSGPVLKLGQPLLSAAEIEPGRLRELEDRNGFHETIDLDYYPSHFLGCNMSFRRSAVQAAGGFDEGFIGSAEGEDTELCLRVKAAGGKLFSHRRAGLVHREWPTGGCRDARDLRTQIEMRMHNYFHFNRKVRPPIHFKLRKLRDYYYRSVREASGDRRQLLAAHYFFGRELIRPRAAGRGGRPGVKHPFGG